MANLMKILTSEMCDLCAPCRWRCIMQKRGRHTKKIIGIVADNGHGMSQEELIKNAQAGKQPDGPSQWSDLASAATLYMDSTVSKYGVGQKMAVAHVRPDPNKQSVKYVVISKTQDANSVAEVWFEAVRAA